MLLIFRMIFPSRASARYRSVENRFLSDRKMTYFPSGLVEMGMWSGREMGSIPARNWSYLPHYRTTRCFRKFWMPYQRNCLNKMPWWSQVEICHVCILIMISGLTVSVSGRWEGGDSPSKREKTQSHEKCQKTRRVPTCPLHALLGSFYLFFIFWWSFCNASGGAPFCNRSLIWIAHSIAVRIEVSTSRS